MLEPADAELIDRARSLIAQRYKLDHHHVGASLRTRSGQIHTAVHLEAYVGRVAVCAEAIALGMAAAGGDTEVEVVVAVDRQGRVVAPCGMCRELLSDYAPSCRVIVGEEEVVAISALLPQKYRRQE
jgi:cytidine deaminase